MNSSISSFKIELKVVAAVLLVLLCIEVLMRRAESKLSIDVAHVRSADQISARVAASPRSLLLLGNSLTREGVVADSLAAAAGGDLLVEAYYPDGSSVNEWAYAYRKYFARPGGAPDFLIIGAGRSHLFDSQVAPDRFGAYFCSNRDIPRYFKNHVRNPDDATRFFLGRFSAAYTNRKRLQPRIFTALIPNYQEVLPQLKTKPRAENEEAQTERRHRNLSELLQAASASGTRVAVLAIPMPIPYPLPAAIVETITDGGGILIDARDISGISSTDYPDNYHLGSAGAQRLTEYLIQELQPRWWPQTTSNGN